MEAAGKPRVCVLHASSYVGFWILEGLLSRGYAVHAALSHEDGETDQTNAARIKEMKAGYKERLSLFVVDVLDYHSILAALNGCSALFCSLDDPPFAYDEAAVEMEVRGAINVVEACAQTQTMEKLLYSSSLTAGIWRDNIKTVRDVDERCWTDVDLCRKLKLWYALAKTLSEQAAWALAMDRMLNMVSINAGVVVGPGIANQNAVSTLAYMKGADKMQENGVLASVDISFLVHVHIRALEDPSSTGRYFCFSKVVKSEEDAMKLAESLTPLIMIPSRLLTCSIGIGNQQRRKEYFAGLKVHLGYVVAGYRRQESTVYLERVRNKKLQTLVEAALRPST